MEKEAAPGKCTGILHKVNRGEVKKEGKSQKVKKKL
jgi:hypothetical protein